MTITPEFRLLNFVEAGLWAVIAVIALAAGIRRRGGDRWRCVGIAAALLPFGASDVVEAHTGAWWRPWWLLTWKAACLLALMLILLDYVRSRFKSRRARAAHSE